MPGWLSRATNVGWPALLVGAAVGLVAGLGGYTFLYARGASYLTNDPAACANCHVMREQYTGWIRSSHRAVAVCNDCHTPANLVGKYATKATNGFWHSFYFTTGRFHEPIGITPGGRAVAEASCRNCHAAIVSAIDHPPGAGAARGQAMSCIRCHGSVGHPE